MRTRSKGKAVGMEGSEIFKIVKISILIKLKIIFDELHEIMSLVIYGKLLIFLVKRKNSL